MAASNAARDANAFARTSAGAGPWAPETADSERRKPVISMRAASLAAPPVFARAALLGWIGACAWAPVAPDGMNVQETGTANAADGFATDGLEGGAATEASDSCPSTPQVWFDASGLDVASNAGSSCGDGLCAGDETCRTCPADCACACGQVCIYDSCASPAFCGIGWNCGAGLSFGVYVNCGPCAGAAQCVDHLCR